MKKAQIALISTAHISCKRLLQNMSEHTDRGCYAIWDDNVERGEKYARESKAKFFDDLDELLEQNQISGFIIASETAKHVDLLEKILPLGKPILCERPLVASHHQLNRVRRLEKKHQTPLICGHEFIYNDEMRTVAELIQEKAFGKITRVRMRNAHQAAYSLWFDNPELAWSYNPTLAGGGGFFDMGTDCVHLLRTLFGHAHKVWASIRNESGVYPESDDFGIGMIRFDDNVMATIEAGWTQPAGLGGLEIVGSQRVLWHDGERYVMSKHGANPTPISSGKPQPSRVDRLVAAIRGEVAPAELVRDLEIVHDCVLIMDAFYESNKQGRWLSLLKRE